MKHIIDLLWLFLLNGVWQIALITATFALLQRSLDKLRPRTQHLCYMCAFVLAIITPLINTSFTRGWLIVGSSGIAHVSQSSALASVVHHFARRGNFPVPWERLTSRSLVLGILAVWVGLLLFRLCRLALGLYGLRRLRRTSTTLTADKLQAIRRTGPLCSTKVAILSSSAITSPVTAGIWNPAIFLPVDFVDFASRKQYLAVLFHEWTHVARHDFAWHIVCEVGALPFWWHPGVRYITSQIAQTREMACDDEAATLAGDRQGYAQLLLTMAKRSLQTPTPLTSLGLFDGEDLERRVCVLLNQSNRPPLGLVASTILAAIGLLGTSAVVAQVFAFQSLPSSTEVRGGYAGKWILHFQGKPFASLFLKPSKSGYSGSMTNGNLDLYKDGGILSVNVQSGVSKIASTQQSGSELSIKLSDGTDTVTWRMVLKDDTHSALTPLVPGFRKVDSFETERADSYGDQTYLQD